MFSMIKLVSMVKIEKKKDENFMRFAQIDSLRTENNFIIVHTEEEFNEKCHWNECIHFLIVAKDNQNLVWQKSSGPISTLRDYLIGGEEFCLWMDEKQILTENHENILILSAEPGMGKSSILDRLTFDSNSNVFCFKIILNNFTGIFN